MKTPLKVLLVLCSAAGLMGLFFYLFSLSAPKTIRINPPSDCNLHKEECRVQLPGQSFLTLSLTPRPIPFSDPFLIAVRLENIEVDSVEVDFFGKSGDTGFKRPVLREENPGLYQTTTDLTHCQEPEMEWQVTVLLTQGKDTLAIPFQVVTLREYGDVANIPLKLSDRPRGGDFVLKTSTQSFDSKSMRGKFYFLYFGYTFCPDICPTALANLGAMFRELSSDELALVEAIFVSVDPVRDGAERLRKYTAYFHQNIRGISGRDEDLRRVTKQYGGSYKIHPPEPGKDYYVVDHSADTYLIDPNGTLVETIPHGTLGNEIGQILRKRIAIYKGEKK
ncbi:MAG: hypothetical protein BroJett040_20280 [Oligoflexia bacterium]|nr:MAG: hypothetical protein BroJett040_20280 [Oligoflexia bacterium]